jgi:hypothetical protein
MFHLKMTRRGRNKNNKNISVAITGIFENCSNSFIGCNKAVSTAKLLQGHRLRTGQAADVDEN